jgi:hypothetical protein
MLGNGLFFDIMNVLLLALAFGGVPLANIYGKHKR